jgi:hypothetical protein
VGRAAAVVVVERAAPLEVVPVAGPAVVVVELVVVVDGVDRVVEVRRGAVVVGETGAPAAVVGGLGIGVDALAGLPDPELEVETVVVGVDVAEAVDEALVVVAAGALVVAVDVLVTVVLVVVDELVDVVDVVPPPAHEFVSVSPVRSIKPAAAPS